MPRAGRRAAAKAQGAQSAVGACRFAETPIVDNERRPGADRPPHRRACRRTNPDLRENNQHGR
jgi:hypothetical protein